MPSKEAILKDRCGKSEHTNWDRSGVEMISLEPETLRQWIKVSSTGRSASLHPWLEGKELIPRKLTLISAATAPSFERA
jgi:hypothetical protein